ncbi:MAG: nuclease [Armatimonadota bacterium]|nr:nuclease [Armatimonadota bacterium]
MAKIIVLDSGVLGLVTNPKATVQNQACAAWLRTQVRQNAFIVVPEIADYEVRRELIRAGKTRGLRHLDAFINLTLYEPLTTAAMRLAAQLWAQARQSGRATAAPDALDGDVIVCAQALQVAARPRHAGDDLVVATANPRHLRPFVTAEEWPNII